MAWEVIAFLFVLLMLGIILVLGRIAVKAVNELGKCLKTIKAQRSKISALSQEVTALKTQGMELRRMNAQIRQRAEELVDELSVTRNKLAAANLIIEQNNARINRRGTKHENVV